MATRISWKQSLGMMAFGMPFLAAGVFLVLAGTGILPIDKSRLWGAPVATGRLRAAWMVLRVRGCEEPFAWWPARYAKPGSGWNGCGDRFELHGHCLPGGSAVWQG